MSKYDYSSTVVPVFIEKEVETEAFATKWTAAAGNANGHDIVFSVETTYPTDLFNGEFEATTVFQSAADTIFNNIKIMYFFPTMFNRIILELNSEKMEEVDEPFASSSILKFITKSKDYLTSDAQIEGCIPDASYNNTSAAENTGRELRKILYNGAPTRSIERKYN